MSPASSPPARPAQIISFESTSNLGELIRVQVIKTQASRFPHYACNVSYGRTMLTEVDPKPFPLLVGARFDSPEVSGVAQVSNVLACLSELLIRAHRWIVDDAAGEARAFDAVKKTERMQAQTKPVVLRLDDGSFVRVPRKPLKREE